MWRYRLIVLLTMLAVSCSYPERADWDGTDTGGGSSLVSIAHVKSVYRGYPYTFTEDWRLRGVVVSSDRYGNCYKSLFVADSTGAVELRLDREELFVDYPMGTQVEIACNGLTIGSYGGMLRLGSPPSGVYETGYVAEKDIDAVVHVVGMSPQAVEPVTRAIDELSDADVGRFIAVDDVQFVTVGDGMMWCDADMDDASGFADTNRMLEDMNGNTLTVRTSRRAEFASWTLPYGSGRAEGILTVFNGTYQLVVIRPGVVYGTMMGERFVAE